MQKYEILNVLREQKKMLEDMGYTVAYMALYGSQNYGLDLYTDGYKSDIDTKAIIVPTLDDLVNNSKPVSIKVMSDTGEIDVKDIRVFMESLLKANPAYVETVFTDYYIIDDKFTVEMNEMLSKRESLVYSLRIQLLKAIYGMMLEKQKALCHPYPTTAWKIEKWKFDGKQSSHCLRLCEMAMEYFKKNSLFKTSLKVNESMITYILDHKLNKVSLEEAERDCSQSIAYVNSLRDDLLETIDESTIDYSIKDYYLQLSKKIIKDKIIGEIQEELAQTIFNAFCTSERGNTNE